MSYRFAHLLLPLQHIRNWMITGKFDVTIEYNTFSEYGRDMYSILLTYGWRFNHVSHRNGIKINERKRKWIRWNAREEKLHKSNGIKLMAFFPHWKSAYEYGCDWIAFIQMMRTFYLSLSTKMYLGRRTHTLSIKYDAS